MRHICLVFSNCFVLTVNFLLHSCSCEPSGPLQNYINPWYQSFSDVQLDGLCSDKEGERLAEGAVVLVEVVDHHWVLGWILERIENEYTVAINEDMDIIFPKIAREKLKSINPFLRNLYETMPTIDEFIKLIQNASQFLPWTTDSYGASIHSIIVPSGSKIIVQGDLHGAIRSLQTNIHIQYHKNLIDENMKLRKNCYAVYTGDYADRWINGIDVWSFLLELIRRNPRTCFSLRGNHEDTSLAFKWGFYEEIKRRYGLGGLNKVWPVVSGLFRRLPHALLIGSRCSEDSKYRFGLFCHGSIEPRLKDVLQPLIAKSIREDIKDKPSVCTAYFSRVSNMNGLNWGDCCADEKKNKKAPDLCKYPSDRGMTDTYKYAKSYIKHYLQKNFRQDVPRTACSYVIDFIVCGHSHAPGGIAKLRTYKTDDGQDWKKLESERRKPIKPYSVFTGTSSPEALRMMDCKEDAFAVIDITERKWFITPHIQEWHG